jgi:hypothetical protein
MSGHDLDLLARRIISSADSHRPDEFSTRHTGRAQVWAMRDDQPSQEPSGQPSTLAWTLNKISAVPDKPGKFRFQIVATRLLLKQLHILTRGGWITNEWRKGTRS